MFICILRTHIRDQAEYWLCALNAKKWKTYMKGTKTPFLVLLWPKATKSAILGDSMMLTKSSRSWLWARTGLEQEMLFSIVLRFGNTWFLLCLEWGAGCWWLVEWLGGCQSWSSQICLDLNFPLFFLGGGQSWSSQICLDLNFPLFWGGRGGQSWSSQICLHLTFPLFFFGGGGVPRFLSTYIHTHYKLDKNSPTEVKSWSFFTNKVPKWREDTALQHS